MAHVNFSRKEVVAREVDVLDVLDSQLRASSNRAQQVAFGEAYQKARGVFVRFPWESAEEREARRAAFFANDAMTNDARRSGRDPVFVRTQLQRAEYELERYAADHPQREVIGRRIAELRLELGLDPSVQESGSEVAAATAELPNWLSERYASYAARRAHQRTNMVAVMNDRALLEVIRDQESDTSIVDIARHRLGLLAK